MMFPGMEFIPLIGAALVVFIAAVIAGVVRFVFRKSRWRTQLTLLLPVIVMVTLFAVSTSCFSPIVLPEGATHVKIHTKNPFSLYVDDNVRCHANREAVVAMIEKHTGYDGHAIEAHTTSVDYSEIINGMFPDGVTNNGYIENFIHWMNVDRIQNGFRISTYMCCPDTLWYDSDRELLFYHFRD